MIRSGFSTACAFGHAACSPPYMADSKLVAEDQSPASGADPVLSARTRALNPVSHDVVLQIRILDRLKASPGFNDEQVSVVVRNRSATLFGSVTSEEQKGLVQRLTAQVSGVIEVSNRLKVSHRG